MKLCTRCNQEKNETEFYKVKDRKNGLRCYCKICCLELNKIYHKANTERRYATTRQWKKENPDRVREKQRQWISNNPDKEREYYVRRYSKHPEAFYYASLRRRARKLNAAGESTSEDIQARVDYYGGKCYLCGVDYEAIDHVIPLSKCGSNWPANLRPICTSCNSKKAAIWPYPEVIADLTR